MPKAKAAALKAPEIDDTLAEPHVSLAHVNYYYDRDWVAAEREYKRGLKWIPGSTPSAPIRVSLISYGDWVCRSDAQFERKVSC